MTVNSEATWSCQNSFSHSSHNPHNTQYDKQLFKHENRLFQVSVPYLAYFGYVGNKPCLYLAVKQVLCAVLFSGFGMVKLELKTKSSSGVVSIGGFQHHQHGSGRTNS